VPTFAGAIKFLLGEKAGVSASFDINNPGFLLRLRNERAAFIKLNGNNVTDEWPESALGYAGSGKEVKDKDGNVVARPMLTNR
jgi:hypothetical protein